ncbi:MAG: hypothetical protein K7J46_13380 [Bryobacter sp.]|jgi:uncharacterized protein (TIGR03437 family)|nr:hypothetical protein [Bryobacter sp. CoA8 C33]
MNFLSRVALVVSSSAFALWAQAPVSVINYSGFNINAPIAPGSIASAYGNFGTVTTTATTTASPLPVSLSGISVRVNNRTAPLYFVSSSQINFVVPNATETGRQTVEVLSGNDIVARGAVNIWDVFPALAAADSTPTSPGIIQNQDFSINRQNARARRGEIIQVYATGCGRTNPTVADGTAPTALSPSVARTEAFVANLPAAVQFSGAHPQFPGICQVNLVIPDQPFVTGQTPLFITVGGIASNPVSVWIQ